MYIKSAGGQSHYYILWLEKNARNAWNEIDATDYFRGSFLNGSK